MTSLPRRRAAGLCAAVIALTIAVSSASTASPARGPALVAVTARTPQEIAAVAELDLVEGRFGDELHVVAEPADLDTIRELGLRWRVLVPDIAAEDRASGAGAWIATSPTTTRSVYRRLPEYEADLHALAAKNPSHVRLITLPNRSLEGREIYGVEIAGDVARRDGRPTSFVMGMHHAREWPAAEMTMDFAIDLADGYGSDPRITALLDAVRVLVVPLVNPDGFNYSREAALADSGFVGALTRNVAENWRKNRRGAVNGQLNVGAYGVDPNRNYGYQWGSGGASPLSSRASANPAGDTYQGHAPFSEPETQNVRALVLGNNVVTLLTNHTYSNLVLWPWGHDRIDAPDVAALSAIGTHMAAANGYTPQQSIYLYPTTGTTEDWAYAATGALGFTMEIGACCSFHPAYAQTRARYPANREAMLRLVEAARNAAYHSVIAGRVLDENGNGVAATLRLTRTGQTPLWWDGNGLAPSLDRSITDTVDVSMTTAADGSFTWHVNPSTRPIAGDAESYTLTVSAPGRPTRTRAVTVARGQTLSLGTITL